MDRDRGAATILIVGDDSDILTLPGAILETHGVPVTKARDNIEMPASLALGP
jgi:CheY-like chemotaxis protein